MPPRDRPPQRLDRSQLPDEFTPETVRAMDMRTARLLARPGNGVLTADEQARFDRALREAMQGTADRLGRSRGRNRPVGPPPVDPELRRSYLRTQRRLDAQAQRARWAFPELTAGWDLSEASPLDEPAAEVDTPTADVDAAEVEGEAEDGRSVAELEAEIEQTTDTLTILEQIAAIQQQQLEHQRSQLLSETRGVFFALAVSVAVIVAGVAPVVAASPADRLLILGWTALICAIAGIGYAVVRAVQSRSDREDAATPPG